MIYKADNDKPHRCPACWRIPDGFWESSWTDGPRKFRKGRARLFAIYTCPNGHRFTKLPIIGWKKGQP